MGIHAWELFGTLSHSAFKVQLENTVTELPDVSALLRTNSRFLSTPVVCVLIHGISDAKVKVLTQFFGIIMASLSIALIGLLTPQTIYYFFYNPIIQ